MAIYLETLDESRPVCLHCTGAGRKMSGCTGCVHVGVVGSDASTSGEMKKLV